MNDILKTLLYLSEKVSKDLPLASDEQEMIAELRLQGIDVDRMRELFCMLQQILVSPKSGFSEYPPQTHAGVRIFSSLECAKINRKNRSFLLRLEQIGVLTPATRELVLDQLMHMKAAEINLAKIKWATLMVLVNQPDRYETACMERFFLNEEQGLAH